MIYESAEQLRTPEEVAAYLNAWFLEAPQDNAGIACALGDIARAEGLEQAPSENGNLSLADALKVIQALGVQLHVKVP